MHNTIHNYKNEELIFIDNNLYATTYEHKTVINGQTNDKSL